MTLFLLPTEQKNYTRQMIASQRAANDGEVLRTCFRVYRDDIFVMQQTPFFVEDTDGDAKPFRAPVSERSEPIAAAIAVDMDLADDITLNALCKKFNVHQNRFMQRAISHCAQITGYHENLGYRIFTRDGERRVYRDYPTLIRS